MASEDLKVVFKDIIAEVHKVVIGHEEVVEQVLIAILCNSNALLESFHGMGKTTIIRSISKVLDLKYSYVHFTSGVKPQDITGRYTTGGFIGKSKNFERGPIFTNILFVDRIDRGKQHTQAVLLEAMEAKQITVGNQTFTLPEPFFVLATKNPIESTYPLLDTMQDRFLLKIIVDYPDPQRELDIVNRFTSSTPKPEIKPMLDKKSILRLQKLTKEVVAGDDMKKRAIDLVLMTRNRKDLVQLGASPRVSIDMINAAKAHALMQGRNLVSAEDIDYVALPVLRHRIILNPKMDHEGKTPDDIIRMLVRKLEIR